MSSWRSCRTRRRRRCSGRRRRPAPTARPGHRRQFSSRVAGPNRLRPSRSRNRSIAALTWGVLDLAVDHHLGRFGGGGWEGGLQRQQALLGRGTGREGADTGKARSRSSTGTAKASSSPAEITRLATGRRTTAWTTRDQKRPRPRRHGPGRARRSGPEGVDAVAEQPQQRRQQRQRRHHRDHPDQDRPRPRGCAGWCRAPAPCRSWPGRRPGR